MWKGATGVACLVTIFAVVIAGATIDELVKRSNGSVSLESQFAVLWLSVGNDSCTVGGYRRDAKQ